MKDQKHVASIGKSKPHEVLNQMYLLFLSEEGNTLGTGRIRIPVKVLLINQS